MGGPQLLRSVGLLADGPGRWGRPIAASGPGVFVIELLSPLPTAPIELTVVGKWIERVPSLRLDGQRPTSRALAGRLASFWLPSQTVLYIGRSESSVARRLTAMARTELGDRQPHAGGYWLKTLRGLERTRLWWAPTDATEEYEDALFDAFATGVSATERAGLPDRSVVLPFANLRRADGAKATGLTGALIAESREPAPPPTWVRQLPNGDAEGARGESPEPRRQARPAAGRTKAGASAGTAMAHAAPAPAPAPATAGAAPAAPTPDGALTAEGADRLRAELDELVRFKRPEVIARIRTAKEHGDLKENAEYHAAREEQSFLEGRIQALEARLRTAVIVEAPAAGSRVGLGSRVTVDADGEEVTYVIVGAAESHPGSGRISSASPVGQALLGHSTGETVAVRTPAGERQLRILEIA
jgi:transcription elongation factor GreA